MLRERPNRLIADYLPIKRLSLLEINPLHVPRRSVNGGMFRRAATSFRRHDASQGDGRSNRNYRPEKSIEAIEKYIAPAAQFKREHTHH